MGFVNNKLKSTFHFLGEKVISKYPRSCILLPILISLLLGSGLLNLNFVDDMEYLYTPKNGPSKTDRAIIEQFFPMNYSGGYDISRSTRIGRFGRIIVSARNKGDILNSALWKEILELDNIIQKVSVQDHNWSLKNNNNIQRNYTSLCARWEKLCYENDILDFGRNGLMHRIQNGSLRLSYPIMFNYENFKTYPLPKYFGGVELKDDNSSVSTVQALLLQYILAVDNDQDDEIGKQWETELIKKLKETKDKWERIEINFLTKESFPQEINQSINSVVPHFVVTSFLMVVFTMGSSMMKDWVVSKPWLGLMGFISALLGTLAGYGFMTSLGVPFAEINLSVPFIMIGIGIDDTFVMLASWRQTRPDDPVSKRIAQCYSEAAVSITITSFTDMLSFGVGIFTPIPSIQLFSIYAATCVLFIYFWQIFLLGGAMTISGYHEQENRHSILWWLEATPKTRTGSMSSLQRIFFTGGFDSSVGGTTRRYTGSENVIMVFFRDIFSPFICKTWVKMMIIGISIAYICVSCWGISSIQEGLQQERLVPYGSYVAKFIEKEKEYLSEFTYRIQVVVSSPLEYSKNDTQMKIGQMLEEFYAVEYMSKEYSENWLRDFLQYTKLYEDFEEFNITNEKQFIAILKKNFLRGYLPISTDVHFNADNSKILASRFIIQSKNIINSTQEKELVINLREVAERVGKNLNVNVTVYHPFFEFADQFIVIRELIMKLLTFAAVVVMAVTVAFIPNLVCCICVFITIASIEIGVLGFMSLWGVSLDLFSINCIVMCIGFSVDFSAHICYSYISLPKEEIINTSNESEIRIKSALHSLGMPILQGGISTIIGVLALVIAPSYSFMTFFKVILLVILFATWHALFLLPVLLTAVRPERRFQCKRKKSYSLRNTTMILSIDNNFTKITVGKVNNKSQELNKHIK